VHHLFLSKRPIRDAALALVALLCALAPGALRAAVARAAPAYVPHEVLVGYAPGPVAPATAAFELRMGIRASGRTPAAQSAVLRLRGNQSVAAAISRLRHEPGVLYAEPNFIAHAAGAFYPNDPGRAHRPGGWQNLQWNMLPGAGVNAPEAWANLRADHRAGGRRVVVAILDTGVAYRNWTMVSRHTRQVFRMSPDFRGTRFVHPYDFVRGNRFPLDRNGHGTFVAGVVGEATNNHFGLTGLAYGASIMPVRVLNSSGLGNETTIARGIRYAVRHGARIINLSLEFSPGQVKYAAQIPDIASAINFAHRRGVTVVGAAGNDVPDFPNAPVAYPARFSTVISVGATTKDRCLADYSNHGSEPDLVAPGGGSDLSLPTDLDCHPDQSLPPVYQMTLTDPPHWGRFGYPNYYIGTSISAPEVSATAALVIASRVIGRHPTPAAVLGRLELTAVALGGAKPNPQYGYGLVDAGAATSPGLPPPPPL
jgi:serine protease